MTLGEDTIFSSAANGNQWYEKVAGELEGATGSVYYPTASGIYYVIVTEGACSSDTSNVINYESKTTAINEVSKMQCEVYPNPNTGEFSLRFTSCKFDNALVKIYTMQGQEVYSKPLPKQNEVKINLKDHYKGIYYLQVIADQVVFNKVLVIN